MLERSLESALALAVPRPADVPPDKVRGALTDLVAQDDGPSVATYLQREAGIEQFREFVTHRSIYHLKEADPHTWAIPRLHGGPKAALVEIQADEYGGGRPERMHAELFRSTMTAIGLDDGYGAYLDRVPGITLAISNTMSLFGLHRRLRGALAGHLAALEMTSSLPNRRYATALRRLGGDQEATRFYDEHVQADAVHEQIAAHELCAGLAAQEPALAGDILYGAACALTLERHWAEHVLTRWRQGTTSLRHHDTERRAAKGAA
ncbi:iron-containing redox enzyme family protein [Nonomuraea zeae]|uniref:iron-containing redox enzyme family protein n=1 Tax=Nonomuraea zeae TaxID=1642303 RepID=UPI001F0D5D2B|nr:iron-containing redox enzyme family protein [Nonomuraea zeae]